MKRCFFFPLLFLSFLLFPSFLLCETIHGKVIHIADGDTLIILTSEKQPLKIRLHGIDAPEKKQAFGQTSKDHLASLCSQKEATVETTTKDRYGRLIGVVVCEGVNANESQVFEGLAWAYLKYSKEFVPQEREAKEKKRGLWQDQDPTPPWEWRKNKKINKRLEF